MRPVYKAFVWYLWNMIFGIAPFLIFGYLWISIDDKALCETVKLEMFHLVRDLIFIFYCVAMAGSVSLDFLFCKYKYPFHIYFLMGVIPCSVFGLVALNYSILILNKLEGTSILKLILSQAVVFAIISIFCIFVKTNLLTKELQLEKNTAKPK
jgi:hypothetical protein